MKRLQLTSALERVNKELWVVLSLFAIALLLEPGDRRPAHGPELLRVADHCIGLLLRPPARDAHSVCERAPGGWPAALPELGDRGPCRANHELCGVAGGRGLGRIADRHGVPDGEPLRAQEPADQRITRDLSGRADDPSALHLEGHLHRESLLSRVGVRHEDCGADESADRSHRGHQGGSAAARYRETRDQPRPSV